MANMRWHCLCAVALLLWLASGLPLLHGIGTGASAASVGMSMAPDSDGCDAPGDDASCPPSGCALCPVLPPAGLALPTGIGLVDPAPADQWGRGLS